MRTHLLAGELLKTNEYLVAPDQSCHLIMQGDGNLCLYKGLPPGRPDTFLWGPLSASRKKDNYFAVMQADGNFVVYNGNGEHVWDTGTPTDGGKFIASAENGGNFTVIKGTPDDVSRQRVMWAARKVLRLLTFNTHLMINSNFEEAASIASEKPVVFWDEARYRYIIQKIKESGADIVALQEVWAVDARESGRPSMKDIKEKLKPEYHSENGDEGPPLAASSGLVLASKSKLTDRKTQVFKGASGWEKLAWKGVLCANVHLNDGPKLRVGITHAWTDVGGSECTNIKDLIGETIEDESVPTILMGDFNIHRRSDPDKYQKLTSLMAGRGATDAWTRVHGDEPLEPSFTDDQINNTLSQFFSPMRDTEPPDCIDYIFLRNGNPTSLRPISARVLRDWRFSTGGAPPHWYWVHKGTVLNMPSAALFDEKLCVVVRNFRPEGTLQVSLFDKTSKTWTHRPIEYKGLNLTSDGAPGVVWFADSLHLFYSISKQVFKVESKDGINWTPPDGQHRRLETSGGICPVVHQSKLLVFVRDPTGGAVFYHEWIPSAGWSDRKRVDLTTRHDISAASLNDRLCVVTLDNSGGSTGGVMRVVLGDDGKWSSGAQIAPNVICSGPPGIMARNGKFEVFFREPDGGGIFHYSSNNGFNWKREDFTGHATTDAVCPVPWNDTILLFFPFVVNEGPLGDHLIYPQRALAHACCPSTVNLDASDHYPYIVDLVWS
jgi:endonuclease/exonuclease/phosphatase family metal-dependent hydrolase